ncbi:VOC family protein, partial [Streptomyces sp. NPDC005047]
MATVNAGVVVLDCAEPEKLAEFYKGLLGAEETEATANRVEIEGPRGFRMAFRRDVNATPPSWPRPENSLQVHLDFVVAELDEAERAPAYRPRRAPRAPPRPGPPRANPGSPPRRARSA